MANVSLIALKRQIAALPAGNAPDYTVGPPGRNIRLYAEPFYLLQDRNRVRLRGTITYGWFPHPAVRFRGSTRKRGVVLRTGNGELWIPRLLRVPVLVTRIHDGVSLTASGLVQKVAHVGQDRPVSSVKFHLRNFHRYVGEPVRHGLRSTSTSRICLHAGRWLIDLDQVPRFVTLEQQLRDRGGYAVGHVGVIRRCDKRAFRASEVDDLLTSLHFFFSFARGFWCGPVMQVGYGAKGTKVWSEWGSWRLTPWRSVPSWFPQFGTSRIGKAFEGFHRRWNTPLWKAPLRDAIHWYAEANTGAGALEGGLILAQAALEMLSWVYVVDDRRIVRNSTFKGYPAAHKIRRLLRELSIPTAVPAKCQGLRAKFSNLDGPMAITRLRNAVVHGKASRGRGKSQTTQQVRFEALHLALEYLELTILAIAGYGGQYQRRQTQGTAYEAMAKVPWA